MLCGGDVLESFNATKENGDRVWPDDELEVPPPSLFKKVHVCILQPLAAASLLVKVILGQHGVVVVGRDDQDLDAFATASPDFYST